MKPAIVILSSSTLELARKIASQVGGDIHGLKKRVVDADYLYDDVKDHLRSLFDDGRPIVAIMAAGAIVRLLASHLSDKHAEPMVISVSDDGASVVPLLGGHHGANDVARNIAAHLGGHAAVTTAGDLRFGIALDEPPEGYVLTNPSAARDVMAALLNGARVDLVGHADWLTQSKLEFEDGGQVQISVSEKVIKPKELELVYYKKSLVLGIGCERGCSAEELGKLVEEVLKRKNLSPEAIGMVASIDLKADEPAIHALGDRFGVPVCFFPSSELLKETGRLQNPSDIVFGEVGCYGVAEGAALAAVGKDGELTVEKQKSKRATLAIATSIDPLNSIPQNARSRGRLFVVGIGPGDGAWRSPEVTQMIEASTDLVGYSLYLDLVKSISRGKIRHDFDLGKEEARVRHAMELAGEGKDVALVCSGDAGIYAMATLVFELLDKSAGEAGLSDAARRIEIAVSPGISALQAAAARIGAPLGHDFCTVSLSDLLTPWDDIQHRVLAAAVGDFVIAFYNPVSKKRRTQLAWARDQLLKNRPSDTPVILATNLGRDGELVRVVTLSELNVDEVDMLTVVIVGSSNSKLVATGDGKNWVYTPRGYSKKADSVLGDEQ